MIFTDFIRKIVRSSAIANSAACSDSGVIFLSMTRAEILARIDEQHDNLRRLHVRELALFGSYARADASESSDIDFIVEFDQKSFDNYMALKEFLEALFARPIDLVLKDSIKSRLREKILREAIRAA